MSYYASSILVIHFNTSQTFTNYRLIEIEYYYFSSQSTFISRLFKYTALFTLTVILISAIKAFKKDR